MKNWILSHKKMIFTVSILVVTVITIIIFIQRKKNLEAMRKDIIVNANQSSEMVAWGEVVYNRIESINIDFISTVVDVKVKEGELVKQGQSLVVIDATEFKNNIEKLNKQLIANILALDTAPQDVSALQADIVQLQNEIKRKNDEYNNDTNADIKLLNSTMDLALKELEDAKIDLQNYQLLYDEGAVSKSIFTQYESIFNQRLKAVDDIETNIQKTKVALKDELNLLNISLKSKQIQLSQLIDSNSTNIALHQSGVYSTEADLNIMNSKLEKDYIKDEHIVSNVKNGIVTNIKINNGNRLGVQGVPTEVLQIIDADSIAIRAEVYEEYIEGIQIGDTVKIIPTSYSEISLEGTVAHIPSMAIEKDGRRVVRIIVDPDDPDNILKPGFTVDVYFQK